MLESTMTSRPFTYLAGVLLLAGIYFGAARLGLSLGVVEQVTVVWPPSGIALAALLLGGYRLWPGVWLGAFLANWTANEPLPVACGIAAANTLEAVIGTFLLHRLVGFRNSLDRLRDVVGLVVLAAGVSTTVSATVGVASLCLGGVQPWSSYGGLWSVWWLGDAMGDVVVAPVLLSWAACPRLRWAPRQVAEAGALLLGLGAVSLAVFTGGGPQSPPGYRLEYTLFPFVIWAALRFGPRGWASVTLLALAVSLAGTLNDRGPFAVGNLHESLVLLVLYMAIVAVTGLLLGGVVAEHKRAEEALRESEARFRQLADAMPQIVWVARPDGYTYYCNRRWYDYTGLTREETIGFGWAGRLHPEDHQRSLDCWNQAVRTGEPYEIDYRIRAADGSYRWFLGRALPVRDPAGHVLRWFGTCTDVDDKRRAEEALKEADRRKDAFLAMLAHELRNPLAPVRSAVEVLNRVGPAAPAAGQAREMIERQVGHMARLIDDLLDVSRISRGKVLLREEPLDLARLVRAAVEDHRPLLKTAGLELTVEFPEGPLPLSGDPTRLAQVVGNLLHNAAKFTDAGGRVQVRLAAETDGRTATLSVRDSGIGMAAEILAQLFEPFSQADRSLDRSRGGLGLGLALVKGLVELHGGTIRAASAGLGRGSEFTVRLPLNPDLSLPAPANGPAAALAGNALHVLIVEDNRDTAESLRLLLELQGYEVDVAFTGGAALESARRLRPDLVLCDIGLPGGMDGYEVARALRADPPRVPLHLIALSGYGQEEDQRRARQAGFDRHLTKPVDPGVLTQLLDALAARGGR
jgi:PAS domain S-box-containing protein